MDPVFTEEQLNRMSREDMLSLLKIMQEHRQKQADGRRPLLPGLQYEI